MPTEVIADFQAELFADEIPSEEPRDGRIVMNRKQVVAALPDQTIEITQSDIVDVVVKQPLIDIEFIDTVLTIAYKGWDKTLTLFVGADPELIKKFRQVLFKSLLTGTRVRIQHPARVGGRVTDTPVRSAKLGVTSGQLDFRYTDGRETIAVADVMEFNRQRRQFGSNADPTPVIKIGQMADGQAQTSFIGTQANRELNLIGRYLRLEYSDLQAEVRDLDLTEQDVKALVTLYSGGTTADLSRTLSIAPSVVEVLLDQLETAGLITAESKTRHESGYALTDKGRIIVNNRLESVNA